VKPARHLLHIADLSELEALEMGPVLHRTATVVRDLTPASQVYVCLWSHGPVHVHYVVQPALPDVAAEFGVYGPRMQAAMFARGGSSIQAVLQHSRNGPPAGPRSIRHNGARPRVLASAGTTAG
jgi:hypothetical protein